MSTSPVPSPFKFMEAAFAFHESHAVAAAIELDIFTAVSEGHSTPAEIGLKCGASERGVRILCDYLCVKGFLLKDRGRYSNTQDSEVFLNGNSPAYMGSSVAFFHHPRMMAQFDGFTDTVRRGGAKDEAVTAPDEAVWTSFADAMLPIVSKSATYVADLLGDGGGAPWKVLDVASSHGAFGIAVAKQNLAATVVGNDWAPVLEYSKQNAELAGVGERYELLPGSAFDVEYGTDFDVILVPNFLHHFDVATNTAFLTKCHRALKKGGQLVVVEFVVNEDRLGPPFPALFALQMLAATPGGDCYSEQQLVEMLATAGFPHPEVYCEEGMPFKVLLSTRA